MSTPISYSFSGSHYEIGLQQGKKNSHLIKKILKEIPNFDSISAIKPRFMPTSLFLGLAKRRAERLLKKDTFMCYPKHSQRLMGIADGAKIKLSSLFLIHSIEIIISAGRAFYRTQGCTSLGFNSKKTKTKEVIIAKNFDYPYEFTDYNLTCKVKPKEGYQTFGSTMVYQPAILDGMNEYGLTVTYNQAYTTDRPKYFSPISMAIQEMLETCKNVNEAVDFIIQSKRAGDAILLLADAKGNIKTVELSSNYSAVREPIDNQVVNTNHYQIDDMQIYEIPHNVVYFGKVPKFIKGVRVYQSSEERLKRAQQLLNTVDLIDEKKIINILCDHGPNHQPSMDTICTHSGFTNTLRSMIFYPEKKKIKILYGNPCQNNYSEFNLT